MTCIKIAEEPSFGERRSRRARCDAYHCWEMLRFAHPFWLLFAIFALMATPVTPFEMTAEDSRAADLDRRHDAPRRDGESGYGISLDVVSIASAVRVRIAFYSRGDLLIADI